MNEHDYTYKIILIGDSKVGKSSLFNKLNNITHLETTTTIGVDFCTFTKTINGKRIKICLWDTAGQEKFKVLIRSYFREVAGIILMFDLTNNSSFENIKEWMKIINAENNCDHEHPILLLGNKTDKQDRNVYSEHIVKICETNNMVYKGISCKNDNIITLEKIFISLLERINGDDNCKGIKKYACDSIDIFETKGLIKSCCMY